MCSGPLQGDSELTSILFESCVLHWTKFMYENCFSLNSSVIITKGFLVHQNFNAPLCIQICVSTNVIKCYPPLGLLTTLHFSQEHSGRVFRLQFDEFQIISSSHDDTILIWDFLNVPPSAPNETRSPSRTYTYISR